MEKNNNEEFIKIDIYNIYIDKKTISSFISKANNFFDSFENYVKSQSKKDEIVNKKLDYIISSLPRKDNDTNNRPTFFLHPKEKQPEDRKSRYDSKKSEDVTPSESSGPFYEENKKGLLDSKKPADSIRNNNEKEKNIIRKNNQNNENILSISINSQFFIYKNNIIEFIDNNK